MKFITIMLITMLAVLQYRLWIGANSMTELHHLQQEKQALIKENESLKERNESLAAEVSDLKQGYDAVEERARSEMGMIKENETFYWFVDLPTSPQATTERRLIEAKE